VYIVKLANGSTVARTRDELRALPTNLQPNFDLGAGKAGNAKP
jgi:hypothetical protein